MNKVRVRHVYVFNPSFTDVAMPEHYTANPGDLVRVINLPSAPKANTMGQCHIESLDGIFLGMVSIHSLHPVQKKDV